MQIIPTNGPMAEEHLSKLREECLKTFIGMESVSVAILDYIQALEGRYMDGVVNRNREFLRDSIEQFRRPAP